ncbi:hypothetical protein [Micromonospora sp. NPDC005299]|uniref:hypothetical protein n=1 Tax=Micromonospora sp. NPDC005299 TaxID=3364231 RepID=UPI00367C5BD0
MSEDTTVETGEGAQAAAAQAQDTRPDEIDWKAKSRDWERKAKANADAAKRLAEIEEANKSEADKAAERLAKAEQTARDAEARALRREVALEHKLSKDDAALLDSITDEDAMRRLAERLGQQAEGRKKQGNHVPREGTSPTSGESDEREFARSLFAAGD